MSAPILIRTLRGQPTERRPIWIMRQAGRYLPEYRELRAGHSFEEMSGNPDLAVEVTLQPLRRFPLDAAIVFADLMSPVSALGLDVRFDPGPIVDRPVRTATDVDALRAPTGAIAPEVLETLRRVRSTLESETFLTAERPALLGFAGGPWSIAAYLVEGQGGRGGFAELRKMTVGDPGTLDRLLGRLTELVVAYGKSQVEAGAEAIQIFETWSGVLPRKVWKRVVKPHLHDVLDGLGESGAPRILFLQDAPHLVEEAADLPLEALSIDWRLDLAEVRQRLGADLVLQGNLDPATLLAGPEATRREARALLERVPAARHIFNLGHGVLPTTPVESVRELLSVVREESEASTVT